ncbi:hydrogenase iron-sulfur subunit [Candidatus Latescibacterota bacterium]
MNKEPIIIAFCCHYCAFTAADLAGTMRQQYPTNVRIVRLPCTGKVDIGMLLHAFVSGADGVMVAGCEEGGCHFMTGNLRAIKRVEKAKKLLEETGVNPERLEMYHIAASQGPLFAQKASEFTERIKALNMESSENADQDVSVQGITPQNCKPMENKT